VWDIGKNTIGLYKEEIANLGPREAVFFKGAPGMFEYKEFAEGTRELLNAMAKSKAFSVIAGGQTSDAVRKFRINKKKIGYVSLSGGALVKYLAGEKLVGLEALKD
ncbi:MAG: phosphoglycerate kinase, partial [Nanoarchaeota archaeon]